MWEATLADGRIVKESETNWSEIKDKVTSLRFRYHDTIFHLPEGQKEYRQAKTASAPLTMGPSEITIESRWIGFVNECGKIVKLRFSEHEKKVSLETE